MEQSNQLEVRVKGSAIPIGNKWGWKMNIFFGQGQNLTLHNEKDELYSKREDAVKAMNTHLPNIQKIITDSADRLEAGEVTKPKKEVFTKKETFWYDKFIERIYTPDFWNNVQAYARYDFQFKPLKELLLGSNRPQPNIILITGMRDGTINIDNSESPDLLDLPFSTCLIESTDGTLFNLDSSDLPAGSSDIACLFVTELEGGTYGFLGLMTDGNATWATDPKSESYKTFMIVSKAICAFINSKNTNVGQQKTNIRFKHKKTGIMKVKKLIHIARKSKPGQLVNVLSKFDVDWSHRWEVRGHWRSIGAKVGKDRNGSYNVKGFTWVNSHIRGPDDKELIKKTRVVSNG